MAVEVVTHWWINADEEPDHERHVVDRWHDDTLIGTYRWHETPDDPDIRAGWCPDSERQIGGLTWRTLLGMSILRGDRLHVRPAQD